MNRFHLLFLTMAIFLASCTKDTTELPPNETPSFGEDVEVAFKIFGVPHDAPSVQTRAIADDGAISGVTAYIFTSTGGFKYHSSRPVISTGSGTYKILLPLTLLNQNIKVHFYSNSAAITNGKNFAVGTTEAAVRTALTLSHNKKWQSTYSTIPMFGETKFTFTETTALNTVSLRRMLARVDVGTGYSTQGTPTENQAGTRLGNFDLTQVKVYQTNDLGILTYTTNNVVEIPTEKPGKIDAYSAPMTTTNISSQKEIYLFEHRKLNETVFQKESPCIIIQGTYYAGPNRTDPKPGWYRLDFTNNDNVNPKYIDIVRNHLYRFNITAVSAPGFKTPEEALENRPVNVTFKLDSFTVDQSDVVFDGQNYLSVDRSELKIYRNTKSTTLSIETSAPKGWTLEYGTSGLNANNFSPSSVTEGSTTPMLVTITIPTNFVAKRTFFIKAANLRKQIDIVAENIDAPTDPINNFAVPEALYFAMGGGTLPLVVTSNIKLAEYKPYQGPSMGKITAAAMGLNTDGFHYANVGVAQITAANTAVKQYEGAVETKVRSINGEITAKTKIVQFANELKGYAEVRVGQTNSGPIVTGPIPWDATAFRVIPREEGLYDFVHKVVRNVSNEETLMQAKGGGGAFFNIPQNNGGYTERKVGTIETYPASGYIGGTTTAQLKPLMLENVPGHTRPAPIVVMQAGKDKPVFEIPEVTLPCIVQTYTATLLPVDGTTISPNEISEYTIARWDGKYAATGNTNTLTYTAPSGIKEEELMSNRGSLEDGYFSFKYSAKGFGGVTVGEGETRFRLAGAKPLDLTKMSIEMMFGNEVEVQSFGREADGRVVLRLFSISNTTRNASFKFSNFVEAGVYQVPFNPALDANWASHHPETKLIAESESDLKINIAFRGQSDTPGWVNPPTVVGRATQDLYVNTGALARTATGPVFREYRMKVTPQYSGTPNAETYLYIRYTQAGSRPPDIALSESTNGVNSDVIKGVVAHTGGTKRIYVSSPKHRWSLSMVSGLHGDNGITFSYPNGNGGAIGTNIPVDVKIAKNTTDGREFQFRVSTIVEGTGLVSTRTMRVVQDFDMSPFHEVPLFTESVAGTGGGTPGGDLYQRYTYVAKANEGNMTFTNMQNACRGKAHPFTDAAAVWRVPTYDDLDGFRMEGNSHIVNRYATSGYGIPTKNWDNGGTDGLWASSGTYLANFFPTTINGVPQDWMLNTSSSSQSKQGSRWVRCVMTRHKQRPL